MSKRAPQPESVSRPEANSNGSWIQTVPRQGSFRILRL
jgi:hypothetical protein